MDISWWFFCGVVFRLVYDYVRFVGLINRGIIIYVYCIRDVRLLVICWLILVFLFGNEGDWNNFDWVSCVWWSYLESVFEGGVVCYLV